jgi:hypothetical protein
MYKHFNDECVDVVGTDLRALLFWATVGVNGAVDGQYSSEIEEIIRSYSEHLGIKTNKAKFRKTMQKRARR